MRRASDDQRLGSLDDTIFIAKLSRVRNWPDYGLNYSVASFSCFHELQCMEKQVTCIWWMIVWYNVVSLHLCKEYLTAVKLKALTQRIFKYGDVQNISLTSDKELYILIYWTPTYVIIYRSYTLLKMVQFFGSPCLVYIKLQKLFSGNISWRNQNEFRPGQIHRVVTGATCPSQT